MDKSGRHTGTIRKSGNHRGRLLLVIQFLHNTEDIRHRFGIQPLCLCNELLQNFRVRVFLTSSNYHEEHITVIANRLFVADRECFADHILRKCRENSFQSIQFSYDQSKPNALYPVTHNTVSF